jgi:hypothetical protein
VVPVRAGACRCASRRLNYVTTTPFTLLTHPRIDRPEVFSHTDSIIYTAHIVYT